MEPLIEAIAIEAGWREQKAAEYPDDERNARAAAGLRDLLEWIEEGNMRALVERAGLAYERCDFLSMDQNPSEIISRFRFNDKESCHAFLVRLTEEMEKYPAEEMEDA